MNRRDQAKERNAQSTAHAGLDIISMKSMKYYNQVLLYLKGGLLLGAVALAAFEDEALVAPLTSLGAGVPLRRSLPTLNYWFIACLRGLLAHFDLECDKRISMFTRRQLH